MLQSTKSCSQILLPFDATLLFIDVTRFGIRF